MIQKYFIDFKSVFAKIKKKMFQQNNGLRYKSYKSLTKVRNSINHSQMLSVLQYHNNLNSKITSTRCVRFKNMKPINLVKIIYG